MADGSTPASKQWVATITSSAPEDGQEATKKLDLTVVDQGSGQRSAPAAVDAGWSVPAGFEAAGALRVEKNGSSGKDRDYISTVRLATLDDEQELQVSIWVVEGQGQRAFFTGTCLPKDTPAALQELRLAELEKMRGPDGPQPLTDAHRAYGFQVYDDLGKDRPPLGGSKELPYPRHLYNTRKEGEAGPGKHWLPLDERFDDSKTRGFNGGLLEGIAPAVAKLLPELGPFGDKEFDSYQEVLNFFNAKPHDGGASLDNNDEQPDWDTKVDSAFGNAVATSDELDKGWRSVLPLAKRKRAPSRKDLFKFNAPRVLVGRDVDVLSTDQEWGRQCIAGMNPCTLVALSKAPAEHCGSAIGPQHVDDELKKLGSSAGLSKLVAQAAAGAKPRLFMIDYMVPDHFWTESLGEKHRAEHAGRALLFLQESDSGEETAMVPLAFELKSRGTAALVATKGGSLPEGQGLVYSRQELVGNQDNPGGELISHWLRCHACMEPFAIALHRQLSTMHSIYKLMLPHFHYTLDINSKARSSLINQGGIIEGQALPEDLAARGVVDKEGKPWIADYPYAQDGLDLWNETEAYFTKLQYIALYCPTDDEVAGDEELQAWWRDVKDKGHPDMKLVETEEEKAWVFAGGIATREQLARLLTTIAWTASAHHASVNFGQYVFASLLLNVSWLVRRPIPRPPSARGADAPTAAAAKADAQAYKKLAGSQGHSHEAEILTYVADPLSMVKVMVTVKLLSIHTENEQTLNERNTLLTDPAAVALNTRFMARMAAVEARVQTRNSDQAYWTRYTGADGERKAGMEYTLLIPPLAGWPDHERRSLFGVDLKRWNDENERRGHELPSSARESCKYCGVWKRRGQAEPLVLATVEGVGEDGRQFSWVARRARKRVLQPHECQEPQPPLRWLAALDVRLQAKKLGWWVALVFALGSLLFTMTGIARLSTPISNPDVWPPGLGSLAALLAPWPETFACVALYTPGVLLAILESTNLDYGIRMKAWEKGGRSGARPRPRILPRPADLHIISWWAAAIQLPGILLFDVGCVIDVVSMAVEISKPLATWGIAFTFTCGGALFTVAGALSCMEETGRWWRGLVPTRRQDVHSVSYAATFFGFWGGVGFMVNGAGLFGYSYSWAQSPWLIAFGQIVGSIFFLLSGAAGMIRSKADICSTATGSINAGDIIMSGQLSGGTGFVDLYKMTSTACPGVDVCYKSDGQTEVHAKAGTCSGTKGSLQAGDTVRAIGTSTPECYTWQQGEALTGPKKGSKGFFNLDALSPSSCPGGGGGGGACKDPGQQCGTTFECCQLGEGIACAVPPSGGPKLCIAAALAPPPPPPPPPPSPSPSPLPPPSSPPPPSGGGGAPCLNPGEQCGSATECCQAPGVSCVAPSTGGPKVCTGAVATSAVAGRRLLGG
ncbi:lipoxygenase [Micractinium conductrix]|uniref:Lipoxygenase n=1 Tax=Micractinium conductrix TaxID=554055 RepID=A0A2P6VPG7_9CHLO|nr:lipoxygenase [Micractinium conductrix]|eukprot:PSC75994.1 lipoxygenase [Micractinium conductrix]